MNFSKIALYTLLAPVFLALVSLSGCEKHTSAKPSLPADKWNTASKKWTKAQLLDLESGERLYGKYCAACHLKNGQGNMTNGFPPLKGSAIVTGPIKRHVNIVLLGKQGTAMPAYTNLTDSELAKIVNYERNAWGNNTGDWLSDKIIQQQRNTNVN